MTEPPVYRQFASRIADLGNHIDRSLKSEKLIHGQFCNVNCLNTGGLNSLILQYLEKVLQSIITYIAPFPYQVFNPIKVQVYEMSGYFTLRVSIQYMRALAAGRQTDKQTKPVLHVLGVHNDIRGAGKSGQAQILATVYRDGEWLQVCTYVPLCICIWRDGHTPVSCPRRHGTGECLPEQLHSQT